MLSEKRWTEIYDGLVGKLGLPCRLHFTDRFKLGAHLFDPLKECMWGPDYWWHDPAKCLIAVNPNCTKRSGFAHHLILHEAAHHVAYKGGNRACCSGLGKASGHCGHWARTLCGLYARTNTLLPESTQFESFAKAAGIKLRKYA